MPTRDRLLAAVVAALWGANFLAIHVGLQHFPPLFLAALRFAVIALPTVLLVPRPQVRLRWLLGYGLGAGYQRWERSLTPIGIIVLVILLLLVWGSKILAARRQVMEDLEEVEAGARHEQEHEREAE